MTERAILAGGCFWGMQDLFRKLPGVLSTRVGYTGGDVPNATYGHHGTHAEGIEIIFDENKISYRKLLEFFSKFMIQAPQTDKVTIGDYLIDQQYIIWIIIKKKKQGLQLKT